MPNPLKALFVAPIFRRLGFHAKRIGGQLDRHFFTSLLTAVVAFVLLASLLVTLVEPEKLTMAGFGSSFYWAITTVIGSGDASYVSSPGGFVIVDDYAWLDCCRDAVDDFRARRGIEEPIERIDSSGIFWRKGPGRVTAG